MSTAHCPLSMIRIGTRKSPLALVQTRMVMALLQKHHPHLAEEGAIREVPMQTSGDRFQQQHLRDIGGKGLFAKELEEALLAGEIDLAVHSLKDMETHLPQGLEIACVLPREDARDVWIARGGRGIADMPQGARIGTSSLRRALLLKIMRPDFEIVPFRGNVQTRLERLNAGEADATLLALAGLNRLGITPQSIGAAPLALDAFLPAACQGIIAIECREDNVALRPLLTPLHHAPSWQAAIAERAMLAAIDGSCHTPAAAHAEIQADGTLRLGGFLAQEDGSRHVFYEQTARAEDAAALGWEVGKALREALRY